MLFLCAKRVLAFGQCSTVNGFLRMQHIYPGDKEFLSPTVPVFAHIAKQSPAYATWHLCILSQPPFNAMTTPWRLERNYDTAPVLKDFEDPSPLPKSALSISAKEKRGKDEEAIKRLENKAFIKTSARLGDGSWHGKRILGGGAHGRAGLWQKVDREGNVFEVCMLHQTPKLSD